MIAVSLLGINRSDLNQVQNLSLLHWIDGYKITRIRWALEPNMAMTVVSRPFNSFIIPQYLPLTKRRVSCCFFGVQTFLSILIGWMELSLSQSSKSNLKLLSVDTEFEFKLAIINHYQKKKLLVKTLPDSMFGIWLKFKANFDQYIIFPP